LRGTVFKEFINLIELFFSHMVELNGRIEDSIIEDLFFEENGPDQAEDVFFVDDEGVIEHFSLSKHVQIVVIE
jgi:hypothetical protein